MQSKNKIALVTGGSRGLGREMALSLAKKGLDVIVTYHSNKSEAEKVITAIERSGQNATALQLDVSDYSAYEPFLSNSVNRVLKEKFNAEKFDFLINNAGSGIHAPFSSTTFEQFQNMVNVHLMPAYFLSQYSLKYMNDGGGIVNISSGLARFASPGYSAYATMKGAVETLTRYQAKELGQRKIRVNVVAPGAIETDFGDGHVRDNKDLNQFIASQTALGRVGLPDDIGNVVAFLCTEEARWINAQRIEVSGGQMI
jgi:NAD(P)-dependent dehydrogenase (short-subunit alcohol dehydrogenase family)